MGAAIYSYLFDLTTYSRAVRSNAKQDMSRPGAAAAVMVLENKGYFHDYLQNRPGDGYTEVGSYDSIISSITSPDDDAASDARVMSSLHTDDFFT
jgi:hypothetical protein